MLHAIHRATSACLEKRPTHHDGVCVMRKLVATAAVAAMTAGCSPGPLTVPHTGAPMSNPRALSSESSSGALESTRRQLTGTWELVALESAPSDGAARVPIRASGTLTYDEFGNLTIDAHTTDP